MSVREGTFWGSAQAIWFRFSLHTPESLTSNNNQLYLGWSWISYHSMFCLVSCQAMFCHPPTMAPQEVSLVYCLHPFCNPRYLPYASTTLSITHSGTNLVSSSSSACTSTSPFNLRFRIFAHSCRVTVELTCRYFGSPSKNIVCRGHTNGPSNSGPHEFSICNCRSSCPSADQVRMPR